MDQPRTSFRRFVLAWRSWRTSASSSRFLCRNLFPEKAFHKCQTCNARGEPTGSELDSCKKKSAFAFSPHRSRWLVTMGRIVSTDSSLRPGLVADSVESPIALIKELSSEDESVRRATVSIDLYYT